MIIRIKRGDITFPGEATQSISPQLSVQEFKKEIDILHNALTGEQGNIRPDEKWLVDFGQRLFKRVFQHRLDMHKPLLLAIELELSDLPWEFLHDGQRFLVLNPGLIRLIHNKSGRSLSVVGRKLRITVLLSSPLLNEDPEVYFPLNPSGVYDPFYKEPFVLNYRKEVQDFTDFEGKNFPLLLDLFKRTRRSTFRQALMDGADAIHFSGHGSRGGALS